MIYSITYGDEKYSIAKKLNAFFSKNVFKADRVIVYDYSSIDLTFIKNNEYILSQKKGGGYWLWKPYIISKTLQDMNDGDYLMYTDSASICLKNYKYFVKLLNSTKQDILCFATPFKEKNWTKKLVLDRYKYASNEKNIFQIEATFIFMKKTPFVTNLIQKWLTACCNADDIMDDKIQIDHECISHRHDQSLFSLICKMNNVTPYKSQSDRYLYTNIVKYYQKYFIDETAIDAANNYYKVFKNDEYVFALFSHHFPDCNLIGFKIFKKYIKTVLFVFVDKIKRRI